MATVAADPATVTTILQLAGGAVVPRCLHAVANLGVADLLDDAPQSAAALAAATGAHPEALERALRLLAANGVFARVDGLFAHSPTSRLLRSDHPQSLRPLVRMFGLPPMWTMVGDIEYSLRTGLPSGDHVLEDGPWAEFSRNIEWSRIFDAAMTAKAYGQVAGVVASYDFSGVRTIGDIGGGRGHLLRAILDKVPTATGVLFDQAHVVDQVRPSGRMTCQAGDFFAGDLPACDVYLLMEVIHDWDDERSRRILRSVRAAAASSRVLIIEGLIPQTDGPSWPLTLDLWMLTISGKQRTLEQYAALLADSGFRFTRSIDTPAGITIVEGTAV
jgi:hypothetical protein